ncbi:uncharacterized protein BXZ73DRAFT_73308 [Epithele typhae]|uniref:uncharacterized protein n=1 Tax=Epithele typhae TaxID=378194 RepID=UPI002008C544|nr:uncharacterized protein BXZ73DRAFT_73308 [Epithele typhae]KAH9945104.1 hypothetical protein BXZ73DRAFT_73308 [Epithele typhae]
MKGLTLLERITAALLVVSASLFLLARVVPLIPFRRPPPPPAHEYTYRGTDFPAEWPLPALPAVRLPHEDSVHYSAALADAPDRGAAAWAALLPRGGATVRLGPAGRPFTLGMFHQLRCLDVLRAQLVAVHDSYAPGTNESWRRAPGGEGEERVDGLTGREREMAGHCLNYLRQSVMCRGDSRLEHLRSNTDAQTTVSDVTHECRDWTAVYDAAEANYADYVARTRDEL